jgi:SAM-dependent methyltransferase
METFHIEWGVHALLKLLADFEFDDVIDIGSGDGHHKKCMEYYGKNVLSVDMAKDADYVGDFLEIDFDKQFDAIWCSHVLEHQRNVGFFLEKLYSVLKPDGVLALVVPTHDREVLISGHVTSWSVPLLCYNLVTAGFDCSEASVLNTYELSIVLKKKEARHSDRGKNSIFGSEKLDSEDLFGHISEFFPFKAMQGIKLSGVGGINWGSTSHYSLGKAADIRSSKAAKYPQLVPVIC